MGIQINNLNSNSNQLQNLPGFPTHSLASKSSSHISLFEYPTRQVPPLFRGITMKSLIFAACLCLFVSGCSETSARRQARIRKECPTYQEVLVIKNAGSGQSYTYLEGRIKVYE
jgi:hypothetical protein